MNEKDIEKLIRKNKRRKTIIILLTVLFVINVFITMVLNNELNNRLYRMSNLEEELYTFKNKYKSNEDIEQNYIPKEIVEKDYYQKEFVIDILQDQYDELFDEVNTDVGYEATNDGDNTSQNEVEDKESSENYKIVVTKGNVNVVHQFVEKTSIKIDKDIYTFKKIKDYPIIDKNVVAYKVFINKKEPTSDAFTNTLFFFAKEGFKTNDKGELLIVEQDSMSELLRSFLMTKYRIEYMNKTGVQLDTSKNSICTNFRTMNDENFVEISTEKNNKNINLKYKIHYSKNDIILIKLN